jgi:uncharacterized protein (TIGR02302 family)
MSAALSETRRMIFSRPAGQRKGALKDDPTLARRVGVKRVLARVVLLAERVLPLLLPLAGIAALFVSLAWFGVFRELPEVLRLGLVFLLVFAFVASFLPFFRLTWPTAREADRLLEERNGLPHQPVAVQDDALAADTPFARALWQEHQRRMAERIAALDTGLPQPDIARYDRYALRAIPALLFVTALAYSGSNGAGSIADAFRRHVPESELPAIRIDAWITPPAYTAQPPVFLSGLGTQAAGIVVPQNSKMTVRISGGATDEKVLFVKQSDGTVVEVAASDPKAAANGAAATPAPATLQADAAPSGTSPAPRAARTHELDLAEAGQLRVADRQWTIGVTPDKGPEISFDGKPRRAPNGALEIAFTAKDDYGLQKAHAEITPVEERPGATPLYPLPDYKLDLPRHNARETKSVASRNITEHPLAGSKVKITLVATDGAGQIGRSEPVEMVLPARNFAEPLAAAVAEQRQTFALDTREMPRAIALNEALVIRADETIPNLGHFILIESARARMTLARGEEALKDTADYLWEIALGIEDGDLSLAERRLRDAQQALAEALENGATDEEIKKQMDELRAAMQEFMTALAQRMPNQGQQQQSAENTLRQKDLDNLLDQLENLARSGNREQAQQLLSELQRMMNNLQAGRPQQGQQQENSEARRQIDKLGEIMQQQQQLMDETFRLDQALRDRMQRGDPQQGEEGAEDQQQDPGQQGQQGEQGQQGGQPNLDGMTAEQLREALRQLRQQQEGLGKQLGELQEGLKGLGMQPGKGFGEAQQEMEGAGDALGKGQGDRAVQGQGRAMEALRQGARDMMNQMMQAMQGQQGQGQQMGQGQGNQNGRDPLGRPRATNGPDFGERVKVPDEIDVQRAREILEAIREKLGQNASPEIERRYLERLLDIQ